MCLNRHTKKKRIKALLLLLKNDGFLHLVFSIWTLFSRYLSHFLTHVFSSSLFFRLPQSLEFAAGQKAAAEAQPIWNAAPPFWRSERERRHETGWKTQERNPQVVYMHNRTLALKLIYLQPAADVVLLSDGEIYFDVTDKES